MTTINGLPAHVLLVHAVIVLIPLTAILLVVTVCWPAACRRLHLLTTALGAVSLAAVPLTTDAGEWLERAVPSTPLVEAHTKLGDDLLPWAIGLFAVTLIISGRELLARRRKQEGAPGGIIVTVFAAILALAIGAGTVGQLYLIGESGTRAAWTGNFNPAAPSEEER